MPKTKARQQRIAEKRAWKKKRMERKDHDSKYSRKRAYCIRYGVWGFDVPEPKPWKGN